MIYVGLLLMVVGLALIADAARRTICMIRGKNQP